VCFLFSSHTLALCCLAKLSTVSDHDRFLGGSVLGTDLLDGLDHIHALGHSSEDNVCAIQPRSGHSADEELTSVGVFTRVGHGQDTLTRVGLLEVLVRELHTVDGLAAGSVAVGEVTSLAHKVRDDSVEAAALVVKRLAALANTLLASAQSAEVLSSLWNNIGVQLHFNSASRTSSYGHIEENGWVWHVCRLFDQKAKACVCVCSWCSHAGRPGSRE